MNDTQKFGLDACGIVVNDPRTCFSLTHNLLQSTIHRLNIPIRNVQTAYWEQGITRSIVSALQINPTPKYLIFFDGDSAWDDEDLVRMYNLIEQNPHVDAIVPVQADRNSVKPLAYAWLEDQGMVKYDYSGPTTQIVHGHFGLTIIRSQVFRDIPQPWFWSQPAPDGTWDLKPGKMDSDTYFWKKFYEHKKMVVQANHTVVGHMELHVRWQMGGQVVAQTLMEFHQHGRPYGLRAPQQHELPQGVKNGAEMGVINDPDKPDCSPQVLPGMMPEDQIEASVTESVTAPAEMPQVYAVT